MIEAIDKTDGQLYVLRHRGSVVLTSYGDGIETFNSRKNALAYIHEAVDLCGHQLNDYKIMSYKQVTDE